ncbi:hypothetical protein [Streptomyces sp. NPDC090036]|uniref:hypothetical protein n=1 Tax=Streptomyces sp. NPDC090036 TaxID=3365926 RepID=UPI003821A8F1
MFSFGAVPAFALIGESPFGTGATPALLYRVVHSEPRLEALSGVALDLVTRCLAKDPAARPSLETLFAAIVALAYTAGQNGKDPDRTSVSQDDNGGTPTDPAPESTDPFDGWSLSDEAEIQLPTGYGIDATDFKEGRAGDGFDVDLHTNWDLGGKDILLLKSGDFEGTSDCLAEERTSGHGTLAEHTEWGIADVICARVSSDLLLVLEVTNIEDGQDDYLEAVAKVWKRE